MKRFERRLTSHHITQAQGYLDVDVGGGRLVRITSEDMKLVFEFDASAQTSYAAQPDHDILILLDGMNACICDCVTVTVILIFLLCMCMVAIQMLFKFCQ